MSDTPADDLSARRRAREEAGALAVEARAVESMSLGYIARDMAMCGLPFRRPTGTVFRRTNGDMMLEIHGSPEHGLPHGQDRLLTIWLATAFFAAGRPADNTIRFRCASDILRAFGLDTGQGVQLRRLRERLLRVFYSTFYVSWIPTSVEQARRRIMKSSYRLIYKLDVNIMEHRHNANQYTLWQDRITLDDRFADELRRGGRVPLDLDTVRALKELPAVLDLYIWQAWRSYRLERDRKGSTSIPVFGEGGLMSQLGSQVSSPKKAKAMLRAWQCEVRRVWQGCPNFLDRDCERLFIHPGNSLATFQKIPELPGVTNAPPMRELRAAQGGGDQLVLVRDDGDDRDRDDAIE